MRALVGAQAEYCKNKTSSKLDTSIPGVPTLGTTGDGAALVRPWLPVAARSSGPLPSFPRKIVLMHRTVKVEC